MISFKLVIPDAVYQKVMWWVNKSRHEVSGFGSLDFDPKTSTFTVRDAILLKQEVGPTSTEIDAAALGKAMFEQRAEPNALKWHWHSHVDMNVFWSQDDRTLIKNLGSQGWIVATVFNKQEEMKSAFYGKVKAAFGEYDYEEETFLEDIECSVERFIAAEVYKPWDKEYDEKVAVERISTAITADDWSGWSPSNYASGYYRRRGFVAHAFRQPGSPDVAGQHDHEGLRYSYMYQRWVYHPCFDEAVTTQEQLMEAIFTMDDDECSAAWNYCANRKQEKRFQEAYIKCLDLAEAAYEESVVDAEEVKRQRDTTYLPGGVG